MNSTLLPLIIMAVATDIDRLEIALPKHRSVLLEHRAELKRCRDRLTSVIARLDPQGE